MLVAGAFHGAWCWELIVLMLEAAGYRAIAVELPGTSADLTPVEAISRELWARYVAAAVEAEREPVTLVGHSRDWHRRLRSRRTGPWRHPRAGLSLCSGGAMRRAAGGPSARRHGSGARAAADRARRRQRDDDHSARAGRLLLLSPHAGAAARACRCQDASRAHLLAAIRADRDDGRAVRIIAAHLIELSDDRAIVPGGQRMIQRSLGFDRVLMIDADHPPFYSAPDALVPALLAADVALDAAQYD